MFEARPHTICLFLPCGGVFLACDFNGLEGVLSDEQQRALWAEFPTMGETKRAGGAAGRFDAANLKRTKSLNTENTAGGHISWDSSGGKKLLRTAGYTYTNRYGEEKTWIGATPAMFGRQLKKGVVRSLAQKLPDFKKLKFAELQRRVRVEKLLHYLGLQWHARQGTAADISVVRRDEVCAGTGETHNACSVFPHLDGNTSHGIEIMTTWREYSSRQRVNPPTCFPLLKLQVTCRPNCDVFFSNLKDDLRLLHFAHRGQLTSWSRLWGPRLIR